MKPKMTYTDLLRHFQKTFTRMETLFELWQQESNKVELRVKSISNLMDQLESCEKVEKQDLPADVYEIKLLLLLKIRSSLEDDIAEYNDILSVMKGHYDKITMLCDDTHKACIQLGSSNIDLDVFLEATPTRPSCVDMLKWMDAIKRHFAAEYHSKTYFSEIVMFHDTKTTQELLDQWKSQDLQTVIIGNIWPFLQYFLQEDI